LRPLLCLLSACSLQGLGWDEVPEDTGPCSDFTLEWTPDVMVLGPTAAGTRVEKSLGMRQDGEEAVTVELSLEVEPPGTFGLVETFVVVPPKHPVTVAMWFEPEGFGVHQGTLRVLDLDGHIRAEVPVEGVVAAR
jgi:hypothetical protein